MSSPEKWFLDLDGVRSGPYQTSEVLNLIKEGGVLPHHRISTGLKDQNWMTVLDWRREHTQPIEAPKPPPPNPSTKVSSANPKRDPMAEMFDIIQTTKEKREAKTLQQNIFTQNQIHRKKRVPRHFSWSKNIGIGFIVVAIGFILGQLFQDQPTSPSPETKTSQPSHNASATPSGALKQPEIEVIDRSTEKMTIRSKVIKPQTAPIHTPSMSPPLQNDLHEEVKDIKKELQELKELKEQLRNAPTRDQTDEMPDAYPPEMSDEGIDPGYNYSPEGTGEGAGPNNLGYPQNLGPQNPDPNNPPNRPY